jgi:hypothetical protein
VSVPHKLKQGIPAYEFTQADRSKGGLARAEKIRAEKAARGETTRRRRRRRRGGGSLYGIRDPYAKVATPSEPVAPVARSAEEKSLEVVRRRAEMNKIFGTPRPRYTR